MQCYLRICLCNHNVTFRCHHQTPSTWFDCILWFLDDFEKTPWNTGRTLDLGMSVELLVSIGRTLIDIMPWKYVKNLRFLIQWFLTFLTASVTNICWGRYSCRLVLWICVISITSSGRLMKTSSSSSKIASSRVIRYILLSGVDKKREQYISIGSQDGKPWDDTQAENM